MHRANRGFREGFHLDEPLLADERLDDALGAVRDRHRVDDVVDLLRLGVQALRLLGRRAYQAERAARMFRRHDDEALDELRAVRQDREAYLGVARRRIADLERVLQADLMEERETEAGWDSEPIRRDEELARLGSDDPDADRPDE